MSEEKENLDRAIGYIRLSQDDSKNPSLSPLNQERIINSYSEEEKGDKKGENISEFYRDINRTGSNLNRDDFKRMMEDARKGQFKRIYIKMWDRLSRDMVDMELTIRELSKLGIVVISCDGSNDPKQRQMMTMLAQWTIEDSRKKTEINHKRLIKNSESLTRPPFGYKYPIETIKFLRNGRRNIKYDLEAKKIFEINEKEAEVVKLIFKMRIRRVSMNKIAEEVGKPVRGIYLMLRNKTYLGKNFYRGEEYPALHKPILDGKIFNEVQKINQENKTNATTKIL